MGTTWISWRTTVTVIITVLQIQALISVKPKAVMGEEGQTLDFRCEYPHSWKSNSKYFCRLDDNNTCLILTDKHNQWETDGRFSLYDNTTGAFFIVKVDELVPEDSGTYWCGVDVSSCPDHISFVTLNVSRAPPNNLTQNINVIPNFFPKDLTVDKLHLPLFLTAVMCMAAILFVCLFTLCLLRAVKHQRSGPQQNRETSCDYETMMPGTEPELRCTSSAPDWADLPAFPASPPDLCSHFTSKHRESTVTLGLGEYADVDMPCRLSQYQHLDLNQLEEHVYQSLHDNRSHKGGPLGVKEQINC
ncbi:transmembrane domain-containing protein TMIGD3-like isoform X2 [Toxotes jaculatrix]|uniref:transmembrane domain-containing protein TMIGD3-like isoform X2 n=1 Tax=Toxotes jaculatrix TaxID=941984 RepID=UPI001B3B10A9|nr:transmembrane domain-containing protein TMIGD3-like isoform X2 [Toxotes jaculatrix]